MAGLRSDRAALDRRAVVAMRSVLNVPTPRVSVAAICAGLLEVGKYGVECIVDQASKATSPPAIARSSGWPCKKVAAGAVALNRECPARPAVRVLLLGVLDPMVIPSPGAANGLAVAKGAIAVAEKQRHVRRGGG